MSYDAGELDLKLGKFFERKRERKKERKKEREKERKRERKKDGAGMTQKVCGYCLRPMGPFFEGHGNFKGS